MEAKISELEELRSRLLDLSLKNNLLNYKKSQARTIEVKTKDIAEVYKTLILDEKGMKFHPAGKDTTSGADEKNIWKYPIFSKNQKYADLTFETPHSDIELRKKLDSLQNKSRTVFEEQGYPVLYLALGFIQWTEKENPSKLLKAPLLLIPVVLERRKIKENYTLKWSGEDPVVSISLSAKLAEQGVVLPELPHIETAEEFTQYIDSVSKAIMPKYWVILPDIILDLFSFKKFVMFKDLDPNRWGEDFSVEDHPLIKNIFHPNTAEDETVLEIKESELDDRLPSEKNYNIMDADASQLAVIEEAKSGKNLVVEGPPGTGKSQTIANMIGELLAMGKTVLFVCEKMAALEVVKRRIDAAGLSRFCLELHSKNANKGELIRELQRCANHPSASSSNSDDSHYQINSLRSELTEYCRELSEPVGKCGFTPYDLFGIREQYRYEYEASPDRENYRLLRVKIENASEITPEEYKQAINSLSEISSYMSDLLMDGETVADHPWNLTRPGMILPSDLEEILEMIASYQKQVENLITNMRSISDITDMPVPRTDAEISLMMESCRNLTLNFKVTEDILRNPLWDNPEKIDKMISNMKSMYDHSLKILQVFTPEIFLRDPERLYSSFSSLCSKSSFVKLFSGDYKKIKSEISEYYAKEVPSDEQILADLNDAKIYVQARDKWEKDKSEYLSLFEPVWKDENTNPEDLKEYAEWIIAILTMAKGGFVTSRTLELLCSGNINREELIKRFEELENTASMHSEARASLFRRLGISDEIELSFAQSRRLSFIWTENINRLEQWSKFLRFADDGMKTTAKDVVSLLFEGKISGDALIPTYLSGYANSLLREAYEARPMLARFAQTPHEQKIATFAEYDQMSLSENAKRIIRELDRSLPEIYSGAPRESEMGVLTGEFNRKRGHISIRSLMNKAGTLVQKIKPCFMMSPLSAAQYLDPRSVQFDVIIFDEASQVKPEDALGALLRGHQLIVMGDSQQLPPTTFFDQIGGNTAYDDETESVAAVTDMESLLHVCRQSYPTRSLRWHYRSKHESLISVSNEEFYDDKLIVFPSPKHETDDLGLSFVYLPETVYDRGKGGINREEAKAVAKEVIEYYKKYPNKTLGVATFSTRQQEAVRHEVDVLLRNYPEVEALMRPENGEDFFVKNLETVQGDERDTILISIGYGFDANHRLSLNFGPLNKTGGERRLNVLITRARERCVVFSNFRGADMNVSPESSFGVAALQKFLNYAQNRTSLHSEISDQNTDASLLFSETVARMLEDNGYEVTRNLGCTGFKIDIAVKDPNNHSVFIAGVLCDGPYYTSTHVARDRDRLRTQVLEGLGWNLIRIWSSEWYQHPVSCTKVLLDFIKNPKPPKIDDDKKIIEDNIDKSDKSKSLTEIEYLDDDEDLKKKPTLCAKITLEPYVKCTESVLTNYHQFASVPDSILGTAIVEIVTVESPISIKTLTTRIRELGSINRVTPTIKKRVKSLASDEVFEDRLAEDEEGFYIIPMKPIIPRTRNAKMGVESISMSEIAHAAEYILSKQFSTAKDDLIKQTVSVFGLKANPDVKERIEKGIDYAVSQGIILQNGDMCLPKEE